MSTPIYEYSQTQYPATNATSSPSDDEGTLSGEYDRNNVNDPRNHFEGIDYRTRSKEDEQRMQDDLAIVKAERSVSIAQGSNNGANLPNSLSIDRSRSKQEPVDQFDVNTNPIHEKTAIFKTPEHPIGNTARLFKRIHESSFLVRYFTYIIPVLVLVLIPLMLGALVFKRAGVGGVRLMWFCVWLAIVWLTLWGGRVSIFLLPYCAAMWLLMLLRFSQSVCRGQWELSLVLWLITVKNGETCANSWKCQGPFSSGGLPWRYPFFPSWSTTVLMGRRRRLIGK